MNQLRTHSISTGPRGDTQGLSVDGQKANLSSLLAGTFVFRLLAVCRPSHVSWFVIAIVVGIAIQSVSWRWTQSDSGKEVGKRVSPSLTDANPATSVVTEISIARVCTPLNHCAPNVVLRAWTRVCLAVRPPSGGTEICAATALRETPEKVVAPGDKVAAALALAFPKAVHFRSTGERDNRQPSKRLATKIARLPASLRTAFCQFHDIQS